MTPEELQRAIASALPCEQAQVIGDGRHFEALIVSAAFRGRNRVQRHRMVYAALGERMREEIHALSLRALTPEEAAGG